MNPPILILHATGSNRDREAAWACELAGGAPEIVHVNQLAAGERRLQDYRMVVLPGGFSYGDDLGAGKLWAVALRHRLGDQVAAFVAAGRPVLGICNGFQALVKAGLLPALVDGTTQQATLTRNDSARFECRWVWLEPQTGSPCIFTQGLTEPIYCPVAHGEGRLISADELPAANIALRYASDDGSLAKGIYPANPNGSTGDIAGLCNAAGNILGLMPHPEDHIVPWQHPRWTRGERGRLGLPLFEAGVRYAAEM